MGNTVKHKIRPRRQCQVHRQGRRKQAELGERKTNKNRSLQFQQHTSFDHRNRISKLLGFRVPSRWNTKLCGLSERNDLLCGLSERNDFRF
jgi:hypothetical protein